VTTVESTGLRLRQFGEQEYPIIESVRPMTKYAVMVKEPLEIRYHFEKALYEATTGRMGPCWLDVPLDVQGALIETELLTGYIAPEPVKFDLSQCAKIVKKIRGSKSPVLVIGSSVGKMGCLDQAEELANKLNIPLLCPTAIADSFSISHPLYYGNFGVFGGRTGNFIVQNADLLLCIGARMTFKQTGFNFTMFAPGAEKIVVDVDEEELKKELLRIDIPLHADLVDVIPSLNRYLTEPIPPKMEWLAYCNTLRYRFAPTAEKYAAGDAVNPYYFAMKLRDRLPDRSITVVGNSCACVSVLQTGIARKGQRLFGNVNCGTMGYDIPAAIGAVAASGRPVVCVTGDGSIQMNIQELQTIVHNRMPVKLFVFNNNGYQAIVQSQTNFFSGQLSGCTPESGVSFPALENIARAYGIPYRLMACHDDVESGIDWLLSLDSYGLCEIIQDVNQVIEPKVMSKRSPEGQLVSPPIDDLAPFLPKEEYEKYARF
jgi:acetolactate synthase I/II/III large subunit